MRLIATVMGTESAKYRSDAVFSLLNHGFAAYEGFLVYGRDKPVAQAQVFKGDRSSVDVVVEQPLYVTIAKGSADRISAKLDVTSPLIAPLAADSRIGSLGLSIKGEQVGAYPLVNRQAVAAGSWVGGLIDSVRLWFY